MNTPIELLKIGNYKKDRFKIEVETLREIIFSGLTFRKLTVAFTTFLTLEWLKQIRLVSLT